MTNTTKYKLPKRNYIGVETTKKQIVFGHSENTAGVNFTKWTTRFNGNYKKTAPYTIDRDGKIYNHFNPKYYSNILESPEVDRKSIVILLENDGWLIENKEKDGYINWIGNIYNKSEGILEKKWKNYMYWAPYTDKQFNSALELVNKLCEEFKIPKIAVSHNSKIDDLSTFSGILYKSNLERNYTDLNPSWKFEKFKIKLEQP